MGMKYFSTKIQGKEVQLMFDSKGSTKDKEFIANKYGVKPSQVGSLKSASGSKPPSWWNG